MAYALHAHSGIKNSYYLCDMGFQPFKMEPDVWIRIVDNKKESQYKDIATCLCDLLIASKSPQTVVDGLINTYHFKLKGTPDRNNELCLAICECIDKMSYSCV